MACGGKLQEKQTTITVVNGPSKLEDGSVCNNELKPDVAYCSNCGTKVDKTLFKPKKNICSKCNLELQPDAKFCGQCGTKVLRKGKLFYHYQLHV